MRGRTVRAARCNAPSQHCCHEKEAPRRPVGPSCAEGLVDDVQSGGAAANGGVLRRNTGGSAGLHCIALNCTRYIVEER